MNAYQSAENKVCDVLIVGSGIAGLLLAAELSQARMRVVVSCKGKLLDSNTANAQGGLAAVTAANPLDSPEIHLKDTIAAGAGLTDRAVASCIINMGAHVIEKLLQCGVSFDRNNGSFDVALEGGHSLARVLHNKDASGRAIADGLIRRVTQSPYVELLEDTFALDLLVSQGRCIGARFLKAGTTLDVCAQYVVLATGGIGQVFSRTTNPLVATGDGIAMAYRAGARLVDMEFVQFHPTALAKKGAPAALISEAVRGAGAQLLDENGNRFAFRFHKDGELATRDIVARAIYATMMEQGSDHVLLDLSPIGQDKVTSKFPNIIAACRRWGIDPLCEPVPISPAAHYFMGGILSDVCGRTTLDGLFAIGECASTGLHGANRLASNSLLEGGAMALLLADVLVNSELQALPDPELVSIPAYSRSQRIPASLVAIQQAMFRNVGLERDEAGLEQVINNYPAWCLIDQPRDIATAERANIALLSWLIGRAALKRRESRGAHYRLDFPTNADQFLKRFWLSIDGCGSLSPETVAATDPLTSAWVARYSQSQSMRLQ